MPNWKKVITSGSNPELNNITASGVIDIKGTSAHLPPDGAIRLAYNSDKLSVNSEHGYVRLGVVAGDSVKFFTDGNDYHFDESVVVDGGVFASKDEDLILRRDFDDTTYNQIKIADDSYELKLDNTVRHSIDGVGNNTFSGNITASGNISSSGTIQSTGNITTDGVLTGNTGVRVGSANRMIPAGDDIKFQDGGIDVTGNITASGNISASGYLHAKHLILSGGSGVFTSASLAAGGGGGGAVSAVANGSDNRLATFSSANALNGEANLLFDGSTLEVVGNISASGNTQVNQITASAFQFSGSGTAELDVQGSITASGDISASGEIRGASLKVGTRSVTVEANSIINQDLSTDANAEFASVVLSGATAIAFIGGSDYSIGSDNPIDFDLLDNNASALSFDASGKAGMLEFVTTNGSEKVKVSSEFIVAGTMSGSTAITDDLTSNSITASNSILLPHEKTITFYNSNNSIASSGELSTKSITITAEDNITMVTGTDKAVDINGNLDVSGIFTADITASGAISASGTITMLTASIGGGIFTSASLAAGGGESSFSFTGNQFATDLKVGRDSDNHIDFTTDNQIDFLVDNETAFSLTNTSDSGSIAVSGSVKIQSQEAIPAVSESRLYNQATANGNVVDDLHFGTAGLTPAYAWVSLDDDGTSGTGEMIFGVGTSAVTSTTYNMRVTHDSSTNGVRIHPQMDGVYKVTGAWLVRDGSADFDCEINVDGSTVHTIQARVHSAVDPVERTQQYVGTISSGSYVTAHLDATSTTNVSYDPGSTILVERLS